MNTTHSHDGTRIAFDQIGSGPALILVGGMFEQRALDTDTAKLAALPLLAKHFTLYHYDRRGRGDSSDTLPFAVDREIEDIDALIDHAGGSALLFGISSGAALAFEAARALGGKVTRLALYEPPYNDETDARQAWRVFRRELTSALAAGRRDEAIGLFMQLLGVPADQVAGMRQYPMWPLWESVAPTMAYDAAALGEEAAVPVARAVAVAVPTLIVTGSESYPFMQTSAATLAQALPLGERRVLAGQTHEVAPEALAPILVDFFTAA
ncbi:MAG: alpha/beta hydrolase [Anaerolineales bacterium]|nr:alpha/beta hydrolase [Anaerolineales bacterium]